MDPKNSENYLIDRIFRRFQNSWEIRMLSTAMDTILGSLLATKSSTGWSGIVTIWKEPRNLRKMLTTIKSISRTKKSFKL